MTSLIGARTARTDGETKVRGEAIYGGDYTEVGIVHAKLLRSTMPAGTITKLDVSEALRFPGVCGVFTAADAPVARAGPIVKDRPLFAGDVVRFEGEPVAAVVAGTPEQAEAALAAIQLEIEPLPAVGSIEASLAEGARLIHPDWAQYEYASEYPRHGNVAAEVVSDPDPDALSSAFARAHLIVENVYHAGRQYQAYLEPKSAVARYENGRFIVHTSSQYPFNIRDQVAEYLGVRASQVRVIGQSIGGGFGATLECALEPYAALFAQKLNRPVKLVNGRLEDMLTCPCRENAVVRIRTALSRDGMIQGRDVECLMDNGAYNGRVPGAASIPMHVFGQVYRAGAARIVTRLAYTNTAPTGAFRGVGGAYLYFAQERHMDECARRLGRDRREFRLVNLITDGAKSLTGQVLEDAGILRQAFDAVDSIAPWAELTNKKNSNGKLHGVGIAAVTWLTNPRAGSVTLKLNEDGTLGLITGATDNGSGAVTTAITQIAAEEFGLSTQDVVVLLPDTDAATYDAGSQGSRTTHIVGRAIRVAAAELRSQIQKLAADLLEAAEADLAIADGAVHVVGSPQRKVPLSKVALAAVRLGAPAVATGAYATPSPTYDPLCATGLLLPTFPTPTYHVHLAEVEVDPDTGQVTVVRYVVAQEVGKAINPDGVRGQIQGGVAQGLGYVLYESLDIKDSRYQQRTLESYRLPLAVDVPNVEYVLLEHGDSAGPHGARGVGEPPIVPVAAAIGNAICDAVQNSIDRIPIRPDDIVAALDERARKDIPGI